VDSVAAAALVAVLDQVSKAAVLSRMEFGASVPVLGPLLRFTLWRNTGIAFGLFSGANELVGLAAVAAAAWLVLHHRSRWHTSFLVRVGVGMVLGGAAGNLADRVRYGYVVDFVELPYWPIFNLADACIVAGGVLLALGSWRSDRR
jgi:signal peptidase II